jgi:hypothetical protein
MFDRSLNLNRDLHVSPTLRIMMTRHKDRSTRNSLVYSTSKSLSKHMIGASVFSVVQSHRTIDHPKSCSDFHIISPSGRLNGHCVMTSSQSHIVGRLFLTCVEVPFLDNLEDASKAAIACGLEERV